MKTGTMNDQRHDSGLEAIPPGPFAAVMPLRLVAIALAAVLAALAAIMIFAAGGHWSGGFLLGATILVLTATGLYLRIGRLERALEGSAPAASDSLHTGREEATHAESAGALVPTATDDGDMLSACAGSSEETWAAIGQGLSRLDIGLAASGDGKRIDYANERLLLWMGVAEASDIPDLSARILLDEARADLKTGGGGTLRTAVLPLASGSAARLVLVERPPLVESGAADRPLLNALFDAAPVGLALVSEQGEIIEFNKVFKRFAPNRLPRQGDRLESYVTAEDRPRLSELFAETVRTGAAAASVEVGFNTQPARTGQIFLSPIAHREPRALLCHLIDMTQQKSLERQFVQAQKMQAVGQLAGGVAHDFNNLLTAIIGFCDLLLVRHGPGDQSFSDIMQIKQNANRAANLVRQLLAFSRQQTMRPKVLMVTDVLADLSNLLRRLIGETIELKMIHGRDVGAVRVDQGQLEQVIINLAVNARDAMPDGGTLAIRTKAVGPDDTLVRHYSVMPEGQYVLIEISDTGHGIPPDIQNKIFEPFFTTKEVGKGTGLGLSTVYGIIKQTGGFIFVESAEGEGTTFRVYLPVHNETEQEDAPVESAPVDLTGKGTILLVEDEDAVRLFAGRALGNKGYKVLEAASGDQALEILKQEHARIDLLISDVVMPNMDGPTLVGHAYKLRPDLRVIFISGYAEDAFRKNNGNIDPKVAFLPKPFSLKQLAEAVKNALG